MCTTVTIQALSFISLTAYRLPTKMEITVSGGDGAKMTLDNFYNAGALKLPSVEYCRCSDIVLASKENILFISKVCSALFIDHCFFKCLIIS